MKEGMKDWEREGRSDRRNERDFGVKEREEFQRKNEGKSKGERKKER